MKNKVLTMEISRLVYALDYIQFLDRSWSRVNRSEWRFAELEPEQNPHGFSTLQARDNMRRFNLRWVPPISQAFFAPQLHEVLRFAMHQRTSFQVPIGGLIQDLADATFMCDASRPVLTEAECVDRGTYSYAESLRRFFIAFVTGEITTQDLRPHLSL